MTVPPAPTGLPPSTSRKETLEELNELLRTLPTTLPPKPGVLWNDNGVLAIS